MKIGAISLPKALKWLFSGLEVALVILSILALCMLINVRRNHGAGSFSTRTIGLRIDPTAYHLSSPSLKSTALSLQDVFGSVMLNPFDAGPYFKNIFWPTCGFFLCKILVWISLCDFLRRMFRNVERHEIFSPRSIGTIRKIGVLIIVLTIASALIAHCLDVQTRDFVIKNLVSKGAVTIQMRPPSSTGISANMSFDTNFIHHFSIRIDDSQIALGSISIEYRPLLLGLVLIGLGEALRQGLAIKEENEFTV